ncbi:O-antigen/teichoic acid export membrane protein [Thiogranum longum]|uniref:O-antigen/teichoic acid export membrane protein n=1 Tax=Thiogranum longum TaxID=1537524 RepID=A0A4R1HD09_9GAMM|nr:flippase [Thiogranum longum]TCK18165.1 O-antigen/teichoic acid export membrane protein [Thiogranum longum]
MKTDGNFRKIAKGGAVFTGGSIGATAIQFVTGLIVIRLLERSDYGLISLGTTAVTILTVISMLGFRTAVPRFLARHRAQGNKVIAGEVAGTALMCAVVLSSLFALMLYGQATLVAHMFDKPAVAPVFRMLALMLPAMVLIETFSAIFQGMENVRAKVIFQDLTMNLMRLILLLPVAIAGLGFQGVLWAYVSTAWITLAIYLVYAIRNVRGVLHPQVSWAVTKDLLWFSFPLLGVSIMTNVVTWAATLTLGYLQPAEELGRFSAPLRLAAILPVPLAGMTFLFLPVVSKLVARDARQEILELYRSTTKWAFIVTMPLLMYFVVDAEFMVTLLFGAAYHDSANVLRILMIGFAINAFTGPNASAIVAFGDTGTPFVLAMLAAGSAVLLCLLLVPQYGALGAALGTAIAKSVSHVLMSVMLYRKFRIHALTAAFLKPVLFVAVVTALAGGLLHNVHVESPLLHLLLFLGVTALTLSAPLVTRTLVKADLDLIGSIERRIWGKPRITRKLRRWVVDQPAGQGPER